MQGVGVGVEVGVGVGERGGKDTRGVSTSSEGEFSPFDDCKLSPGGVIPLELDGVEIARDLPGDEYSSTGAW